MYYIRAATRRCVVDSKLPRQIRGKAGTMLRLVCIGILAWCIVVVSGSSLRSQFVVGTKGLSADLADEAGLFFRRMDADGDARVSETDARARSDEITRRLPDVSVDDFVSFIQNADQDGDRKLDRDEMVDGFSLGLLNSGASLIEEMDKVTDTRSSTEQKSSVAAEIEAAVAKATKKQSGSESKSGSNSGSGSSNSGSQSESSESSKSKVRTDTW